MVCHVALVRTDVPEERTTFIIRVTGISDLRTMLAATSNRSTLAKKYHVKKSIRIGYKGEGRGR
jgi:hypothetical protein